MLNPQQVNISQYANSPTISQLIDNFSQYIDPRAAFDQFYNIVWNVDTAQGFGLDIWGRIVNVSRQLTVTTSPSYFGFLDGVNDMLPFGQAPFYNGPAATATYELTDDAYRQVILVKALANISVVTAPALNALLQKLFAGRGRCYVNDNHDMSLRFVFEFNLEPYEVAIITSGNVFPRPAGVLMTYIQVPVPNVFGFVEAGASSAPFNQGVFYSS